MQAFVKQVNSKSFVFLFLFILLFSSCRDEIFVGSGLLDNEKILVDFTDNITLKSETIAGKAVNTFDSVSVSSRQTVVLGQLNDNVFGKFNGDLALTINLNSTPPSYPIDEKPLKFDSLVLVLTYDTLGNFGQTNTEFDIDVYQLNEKLPRTTTIKSDLNVDYNFTPIGSKTTSIASRDSVPIINHLDGKAIKQLPQLRIKLDNVLGESILKNKDASLRDSAFVELLKGIYVKATPQNQNATFGLNLSSSARTSTVSNRLIMYYTEADTAKKTYNYAINSRFVNKIERDIAGSKLESQINDPLLSNQFSYVQGMAGPKTKISFPDISALQGKFINYVALELTVEEETNQVGIFRPIKQILAERKHTDSTFVYITDIIQTVASFETVFGGGLKKTNGIFTYRINITNHIKQALKDPEFDSDIYITTFSEIEDIYRSVLYGADHPQYKMKMKVNFTQF